MALAQGETESSTAAAIVTTVADTIPAETSAIVDGNSTLVSWILKLLTLHHSKRDWLDATRDKSLTYHNDTKCSTSVVLVSKFCSVSWLFFVRSLHPVTEMYFLK